MVGKRPGRPPAKPDTMIVEIGDNFTKILELVLHNNHEEILDKLGEIMTRQEELDAKVDRIEAKILAEKEQLAEFIANNPALNTSRLEALETKIGEIFEPPTTGGETETETETETTEETTET